MYLKIGRNSKNRPTEWANFCLAKFVCHSWIYSERYKFEKVSNEKWKFFQKQNNNGIHLIFYFIENDYVLRSCMSSVELSRRNIGLPVRKLPVALERPSGRIAASTVTRLPLSLDRIKSAETKTREKSQQISVQQRLVTRGRPSRVMVAETPLRTLSLQRKSRYEGPQLFVRNDQLPEVRKSSYRGESTRNEATIILIQSA